MATPTKQLVEVDDPFLLPPELRDIEPLGDEEFASLGQRFWNLAEKLDVEGLERTVAEALWNEETDADRLHVLVQELCALLMEVTGKMPDADFSEHLSGFGPHVVSALWKMSLSPALGRVLAREGKAEARCCVLILGFAGSHVHEVAAQEDFYRSLGFCTIMCTQCLYPVRIQQRQYARLAHALRQALTTPNTRLVLHVCSGHGLSFVNNIIYLWTKGLHLFLSGRRVLSTEITFMSNIVYLWTKGKQPFDDLPCLSDCVAAIVWECAAPIAADELESVPYSDKVSDKEALAEHLKEDAAAGNHAVFFGAACNTLNSLTERCAEKFRWWSMAGKHRDLGLLLRSAHPALDQKPEGPYGAALPFWRQCPSWYAWEVEVSTEKMVTVPRLFLYSAADGLIHSGMVEAAIDSFWLKFPKSGKILVEKLTKSSHCKLWTTERKQCEKAVAKLLRVAKIHKH